MLEDGAYLGKSLKGPPAKKLPLELIVKPSECIVKLKDNSENNPIHKMECSAENAVGKTSLSSVQNSSQPSNHRPFSGNPPSPSVVANTEMSPWCFPQPAGHQWLIPVMSPSEGLIYKPYPGHGFVGSVCGSFGPSGPNPLMGCFVNPAYGGPPSHYSYQGIGIPSASPPAGHGYFPPHGIPLNPAVSGTVVEQPNRFSGIGSDGQSGQLSGGKDNFNTRQHRSLHNVPTQNGVISNVIQPRASRASDLQGSTASSPGEKAERIGIGQAKKGRNAFDLFPTSADVRVPDGVSWRIDDTDQRTKVIKVVPHNARSATESAARIFRSIQEERIVHDSV